MASKSNIGNGRTKKTGPERIAREQRTGRIFAARLAGKSLVAIAAAEGISKTRVAQIVQAELEAIPSRSVADMRAIEAARLDELQAAVWPKAMNGNLKAVETVIGIMGRRARLLGVDVPTRVTVDDSPAREASRASLEAKLMALGTQVAHRKSALIEGTVVDREPELLQVYRPEHVQSRDPEPGPEPEQPDPIMTFLIGGDDPYGESGVF